jgi:hypothetical protein
MWRRVLHMRRKWLEYTKLQLQCLSQARLTGTICFPLPPNSAGVVIYDGPANFKWRQLRFVCANLAEPLGPRIFWNFIKVNREISSCMEHWTTSQRNYKTGLNKCRQSITEAFTAERCCIIDTNIDLRCLSNCNGFQTLRNCFQQRTLHATQLV